MKTIEELIYNNSCLFPQKIAIKSGKESVTYNDLWINILLAKSFFESQSFYKVGASVILAASKQIEFVYAYFGAHMAGLIVVPIDSETNPTRFSVIDSVANPACVIGFEKIDTKSFKLSLKDFKDMEGAKIGDFSFPNTEKTADILFTTGTTGQPKGVPLTFLNESSAAMNINSFIQNDIDDVELLALPISHSFGLGRLRCCLIKGQTIILLGSFVNVKRIFKTIEEENVSGFSMVPSSWNFLHKMSGEQIGEYSRKLKYIEMGSAYLSVEDKKKIAKLLPLTRICMHYGLTEASRSAFLEFHEDCQYLATVGKASPNVDIKIFSENGECLDIREEGEIAIKGLHVTSGYLNQERSDNFFYDYFRTGDCGFIDEHGYLTLKSRIKELINVGGKKVAPQEVDDQIIKIAGIQDCACVGVEDPNGVLGEVVKAYIVKDKECCLTFDDISNALIGKLEGYKIPVLYEWLEEIPKTKNGKIQRNLLI